MGNFTIKPDIRADIWEGAIGWAFGSHIWSGKIPDFPQKPIKLATKTNIIEEKGRVIWDQLAKKVELVSIKKGRKEPSIKNIPIWVSMRYHIPATLLSFLLASWMTKK